MIAHYEIVCEETEDRYGSAASLDAAATLAKELLAKGLAEGPLAIEYQGLVLRQYAVGANGTIVEQLATATPSLSVRS